MSRTQSESEVVDFIQDLGKLDDHEVKLLYKAISYEARSRSVLDDRPMQAEIAMEKAEGDILSRRRKAELILESKAGAPPVDDVEQYYGSLTCIHYQTENKISVYDVDGEIVESIDTRALPQEDPERIEMLQALLDAIHLSSLSRL